MILKSKYAIITILGILPVFAHATSEKISTNWEKQIDLFFGEYIVGPLAALLFWPIPGIEMPLVVAWLLGGALFFTLQMRFASVSYLNMPFIWFAESMMILARLAK